MGKKTHDYKVGQKILENLKEIYDCFEGINIRQPPSKTTQTIDFDYEQGIGEELEFIPYLRDRLKGNLNLWQELESDEKEEVTEVFEPFEALLSKIQKEKKSESTVYKIFYNGGRDDDGNSFPPYSVHIKAENIEKLQRAVETGRRLALEYKAGPIKKGSIWPRLGVGALFVALFGSGGAALFGALGVDFGGGGLFTLTLHKFCIFNHH